MKMHRNKRNDYLTATAVLIVSLVVWAWGFHHPRIHALLGLVTAVVFGGMPLWIVVEDPQ